MMDCDMDGACVRRVWFMRCNRVRIVVLAGLVPAGHEV